MKDLISCGNDYSCFKKTNEIVQELVLLKEKILNNIKSGHAVDKRNISKLTKLFREFQKEFFSAKVVKCLKKNCQSYFPMFQGQLVNTLSLVQRAKSINKKMDESHLKTIKLSVKFLEKILKNFEKHYGIIIKQETNFADNNWGNQQDNVNLGQNFRNYVKKQVEKPVNENEVKRELKKHIIERLSQPERNGKRLREIKILVLGIGGKKN